MYEWIHEIQIHVVIQESTVITVSIEFRFFCLPELGLNFNIQNEIQYSWITW